MQNFRILTHRILFVCFSQFALRLSPPIGSGRGSDQFLITTCRLIFESLLKAVFIHIISFFIIIPFVPGTISDNDSLAKNHSTVEGIYNRFKGLNHWFFTKVHILLRITPPHLLKYIKSLLFAIFLTYKARTSPLGGILFIFHIICNKKCVYSIFKP